MSRSRDSQEEDLQAASERQGALASITATDRDWLLAAMLLDSLEDDLAAAHCNGWWQVDPAEMLGQPTPHRRFRSCHPRPAVGAMLAQELDSPAVQCLYDIIRGCTGGRLVVGRGSVIRNARRKAVTHGRYVRRRRAETRKEAAE